MTSEYRVEAIRPKRSIGSSRNEERRETFDRFEKEKKNDPFPNRSYLVAFLLPFVAPDVRMAVGLQLQVPAGRLLPQSVRFKNGESLLVVLYQQVYRIRRHGKVSALERVRSIFRKSMEEEIEGGKERSDRSNLQIFFVLRKKESQVTFLHLYHHSLTPLETWICVKFIPGGHGTLGNLINNAVHVVMYAYYMLAAMGPEYKKYLWWKKHLTTIQLVSSPLDRAFGAGSKRRK
ncbi:hypothetical protein HZH68_001889 [Vespula germanica]|uniref:Elongation of very long chain fatty acids protein n=1 Tax=Vespula germanica TaxID=30212 RepID=A0A834NKE6_VESGE|nr:hypothetical protein HZH68_001889 [Vespula germanica]